VLLALLVVLIPTACVLWFLNEAVHNERLAARQKLLEAYRGQLPLLRDRLDAYWRRQAEALDAAAAGSAAPAAFAACVRGGLAEAVVCYAAAGQLAYPAPTARPNVTPPDDDAWAEAGREEHAGHDLPSAAAAYGRIAARAADPSLAARALQAQARCLARAGRTAEAAGVLTETLGQAKYAKATDADGRLIAADAQLRALELWGDSSQPGFAKTAASLAKCLDDYSTPLAAPQRRFLMEELARLTADASRTPTLQAERLAAAYVDAERSPPARALRPSGLTDVWHFASPSGRIIGLVRTHSVLARSLNLLAADGLAPEVRLAVLPPDGDAWASAVHVVPAGARLPGWRLALALDDSRQSAGLSGGRVSVYVWIATLVIVAMSIVALLVAGLLRRQMRLTRLKNDLLATVSHELKTPLASIRLLVDTLLDSASFDAAKTREYLALMAKENARLSRLIDNFLSFSRMERGKQTFELAEVSPAEIVRRAVDAAGERFQSPVCRLQVETAADLPNVLADSDALVTALLNLLDNAYKYSGNDKRLALRTSAAADQVCFAVTDNGIGLSPRAAKKVFRPFYQVDRHLSRGTGGCGLGLSIVRSIADAHGGTVRVESRPGEGSTFTISIPNR
jgi:signal transduction histidine kinase